MDTAESVYKGYVPTRDKQAYEKAWYDKGRTLEQIERLDLEEYAGIISPDFVCVDADDPFTASKIMDAIEDMQLSCMVRKTNRGLHFFFRNTQRRVEKCQSRIDAACGLTVDYKCGLTNCYCLVKRDGETREVIWDFADDDTGLYDEIPVWLLPVGDCGKDLVGMGNGEGRNSALWSYSLKLQHAGFGKDDIKAICDVVNRYVFDISLSPDEFETIMRDEGFKEKLFFVKSKFQHRVFGEHMITEYGIKRINGVLHIFDDGVYIARERLIKKKMIEVYSNITDRQRTEALKYIDAVMDDDVESAPPRFITFANCVLDIETGERLGFSKDLVLVNRIPWSYDPQAYNADVDRVMDKLACGDPGIRELLEECVGYCMYRSNVLHKAFIMLGNKSNGKSTFLKMLTRLLGDDNVSALEIQQIGDRFSTAQLAGKLANIGDDVADDFMKGNQASIFKKVVTGERIQGEFKGQDPFEFRPYAKLVFSANEIPRIKDDTEAVLRRLVIVPFNAVFSPDDEDYDPHIDEKLQTPEAIEYLIRLGVEGLKRALENKRFTECEAVKVELETYKRDNSPIQTFTDELPNGLDDILNELTDDVFARWRLWCEMNGYQAGSKTKFTKALSNNYGVGTKVVKVDGKAKRAYVLE